jgi:hypothetical protein
MDLLIKEKQESTTAANLVMLKHEADIKKILTKQEQAEKKNLVENEKQFKALSINFNNKLDIVIKEKENLESEMNKLKKNINLVPESKTDLNGNNLGIMFQDLCGNKKNINNNKENIDININNSNNSNNFDSFAKFLILARMASSNGL